MRLGYEKKIPIALTPMFQFILSVCRSTDDAAAKKGATNGGIVEKVNLSSIMIVQ